MNEKKEVIFNCYTEDMNAKEFDIYINGEKINKDIVVQDNKHFQFKWICMPGQYKVKAMQNHPLNSRTWGIYPMLAIISMIFSGFNDEINQFGASYAEEEGELLIDGNSVMEIKLRKSEVIFKLGFGEIYNYEFQFEPKSNCSYRCFKKEIVSTTKLKTRFIISILLPITVILLSMDTIFVLIALQVMREGLFLVGTILMLVVILLLIPYGKVTKNILSAAKGKK